MKPTFLTAEWRKLAIFNYSVDPELLKAFLPYKTALDLFNGKCLVSIVGFRFIETRIKGFQIPFHINFEEINLRFYVRYKDGDTWKRGVTFIQEIVPKAALTIVANTFYNEKYVTFPTKHAWKETNDNLSVLYEWKHLGNWDSISLNANPVAIEIPEGSEEEFITEHYWGYTVLNKTSTSEYQVAHPRWKTYLVKDYKINIRFAELYGKQFDFLKDQQPDSVMLAEGSLISVNVAGKIK